MADTVATDTSSQPIRRHSRCQFRIVPINHYRTVAHLFAQRVYVSLVVEQFQSGVGVAQ